MKTSDNQRSYFIMKKLLTLLISVLAVGCTTNNTPNINLVEYTDNVRANIYYPEEAMKQGLEGTAVIKTQINRMGNVIGVEVAKTSGSSLLDTAAIRTLLATKFPKYRAVKPVTILIPVKYKLDE